MRDLFDDSVLAPQPLDFALTLPARFYTDPRMPQLDARAIFARSWLWSSISRRWPTPAITW